LAGLFFYCKDKNNSPIVGEKMYTSIVKKRILNNFQEVKADNLLTESGIRIPEGTKSVKLVCH